MMKGNIPAHKRAGVFSWSIEKRMGFCMFLTV